MGPGALTAPGAAIRAGRAADSPVLREIETVAGARFRDIGMADIADNEPMSVQVLDAYASDGRSWVAVDEQDRPIGYVVVDVVDGDAHIEQISVHPDHQGRGLAHALIDQVRAWAAARGMAAVTLTTFTDVPWNRPLYEHLGFRVLTEDELRPELRAVRDEEAAHGLDPATRVCMLRSV